MKLPAVAIVAAFASGIALGLHLAVVPHLTSVFFPTACFLVGVVLVVTGLAQRPRPANPRFCGERSILRRRIFWN